MKPVSSHVNGSPDPIWVCIVKLFDVIFSAGGEPAAVFTERPSDSRNSDTLNVGVPLSVDNGSSRLGGIMSATGNSLRVGK